MRIGQPPIPGCEASAEANTYAADAGSSHNETTYIERVIDQVLAHASKHFEAGQDVLHVIMHVRLDPSQRLVKSSRNGMRADAGLARHANPTAKGTQ